MNVDSAMGYYPARADGLGATGQGAAGLGALGPRAEEGDTVKTVDEVPATIEPGDEIAVETPEGEVASGQEVGHGAPGGDALVADAPVGRGRRVASFGVALYMLGQAVILFINGAGGSNDLLMANIMRLAVLGMVGGLAIGGRVWARWFIGVLALLNALTVGGFGLVANTGTASTLVLALTGGVLVAFLAAAYLLLLSPAHRR